MQTQTKPNNLCSRINFVFCAFIPKQKNALSKLKSKKNKIEKCIAFKINEN